MEEKVGHAYVLQTTSILIWIWEMEESESNPTSPTYTSCLLTQGPFFQFPFFHSDPSIFSFSILVQLSVRKGRIK